MPLVFAENEATESGITYEDRTGSSYEYPKMYRRLIQSGERFVYYKGRKKHGGGRAPQIYFGTGIVGSIIPAGERLVCEVLDYRPFEIPVPFKSQNGEYLEAGGRRKGYFQRGVRAISEGEFEGILAEAQHIAPQATSLPATAKPTYGPMYGSPGVTRDVEEFSVRVALAELRRRYPNWVCHVLPRNNPGFDILVKDAQGEIYVEVKGTQRRSPCFLVTEGELQFSRQRSSLYRLLVVYGINLVRGDYRLHWHEGAILPEAGVSIRPLQWMCEIQRSEDGS